MARQVLTVAGTIIGAYFGYPQLGYAIGSLVGNAVDPVQVEGPKLGDAAVMQARDGIPIPWGDGIFRVAGTMIACQPGKPTEHKVKKRQGKGGGPVQVTYTYTRTHAVLVCEGPIIGIRRIWRNKKLVYDQTPLPTAADEPDPTSLTALIKLAVKSKASGAKFAQKLTIYLGDESQLPDPTLEAMFGVGEVGANRGIAYVVIEDDDVTDSGGAVPQYEFEVARAGASASEDYVKGLGPEYYYKLTDTSPFADYSGNSRQALTGGGSFTEGSALGFSNSSAYAERTSSDDTGLASITSWTLMARVSIAAHPGGAFGSIVTSTFNDLLGHNGYKLYLDGTNNMVPYIQINNSGGGGGYTAHGSAPLELDTEYLIVARRTGTLLELFVNGSLEGTATVASSIGIGSQIFYVGASPSYGGGFAGSLSYVAAYRRALTDAEIASLSTYFLLDGRTWYTLPDDTRYYVTDSGEVGVVALGVGETIADDTPTLADVITAICSRCGLTTDDIDVTDVASVPVTGYFVARAAAGDACLKPLLEAFQVGMFEADGKIRFVQLGADTVADLDIDDLVAQEGPPVTETRSQEVELPRKVNVLYADPATAYTTTKQTSERMASDVAAVGELNLELPVVMSADQAAQIAHRKEKALWIELLGGLDFALPDEFSRLTPTDNVNLTYRGRTSRVRIDKVDSESGQMMLSTRQDRQSAYSSDRTGTNPSDFYVADTLVGPTFWKVMLLPQLRPQDVGPGVYFACTGVLPGWRGCELQVSVDSGASWITLGQYDSPNAIGYLTASITNSATVATVTMYGTNELESVTTAQVNTGSNRAAIVTSADVCEIVTFEDATLDSGGDYDLATMTRGVLATAAASHLAGEKFIQLDGVNFVPIPLDYDGDTLIFRAVSLGTLESNNGEQTLVFSPPEILIDGGGA